MIALLTPAQVAVQLGISEKTLANWRSLGHGPDSMKLGGRVRYEEAAVDAFIEAMKVEAAS